MANESTKIVQVNDDGFLEELDLFTGELHPLEEDINTAILKAPLESHKIVRDIKGNMVYVPHNATVSQLRQVQGKNYVMPYSKLLATEITDRIANGEKIKDICIKEGMPKYSNIGTWRREHKEFDAAMRNAKKDRAEYYFEKALSAIENATEDRDTIALAKLRADFYKASAKVSDETEYGDKQHLSVSGSVGIYSLETGIRRVGDAGFNDDETMRIVTEIEGKTVDKKD